MTAIVYLNGTFIAEQEARVSIRDRGFTYGDALFETMRTYGGRVFRLDLHLDRLARSAGQIFLSVPESRERLSALINETLLKNNLQDAVVRLTLTRGEADPGLRIADNPPTLLIQVRPVTSPAEASYQDGVAIGLFPNTASRLAGLEQQIKSANYLSEILVKKMADQRGLFEGILMDDQGRICDGTVSNIFLVTDEGVLRTPAVNAYVLAGTTRQVVLESALAGNRPVEETDLYEKDVLAASEVFLTNTGIQVLPVTEVNDRKIGAGQPGPVTLTLHRAYLNLIDAHVGQ